jgi:hypothetical protein
MIEISFNKEELDSCRRGANLRYQFARKAALLRDIKDKTPGKSEGSNPDYQGIRGELAVAKAFELDFDPFRGIGVDNGIDFWWNETSIDVKATPYITGRLIFIDPEKFKSDIAVLAIEVKEDFYRVPGWISKERFKEICKPFMEGYAVEQEDLKQPSELWEIMTNWKNKK